MKEEKIERVTLTVTLREREITALQRSIEEMEHWRGKVAGAVKSEYDITDAIRWALYDGITQLIKDQRIDDCTVG